MSQLICGDCYETMRAMPAKSARLVIGSPPYAFKGKRYEGVAAKRWPLHDWIEWMADITEAAVNVSTNCVVWVCNGTVKDGEYQPAVEGLIWRLHQEGFACERPVIWTKNSPPNRKDWFGNDWEFCVAVRPKDSDRYFDGKAIGTPPKFKTGGHFRQRGQDGKRRKGGEYPTGKLTHPRDVLRATVGGGHMGSKLAHLNEAPFPEKLIEPFILALTKPGDVVVDPFCGSGTTCSVAQRLGRQYVGIDSRQDQIDLTTQRLQELANA